MDQDLPLLQYPHEVIRYHLEILGANLQYRLSQGEYCEIREGVFAAREAKLGEYCVTDTASGPIILEENVWLGARVIVLRGVTVGAGSVIGAGSVVTRDIPPRSVAAGLPARVIRAL